ncbi:MAG TPA: FliH/SctL family protein [Alphaproteobacteria bacterium]|nr:FliH/SctL family protein [Alphaproteobacteria bacterium]
MTAAHKFLFDRSFDDAVAGEDEARTVKRYTESDLAAACAAARLAGREEGHSTANAAAMGSIGASTARALQTAAQEIGKLGIARTDAERAMTAAGLQLAAAIARKAIPEIARRNGIAEIEALVSDCLAQLIDEPRIVIRVHDSLLDSLDERVRTLARAAGFEGKLVLVADAALGLGDCRIEWADGGVERNLRRLFDEIDAAVARSIGQKDPQMPEYSKDP